MKIAFKIFFNYIYEGGSDIIKLFSIIKVTE